DAGVGVLPAVGAVDRVVNVRAGAQLRAAGLTRLLREALVRVALAAVTEHRIVGEVAGLSARARAAGLAVALRQARIAVRPAVGADDGVRDVGTLTDGPAVALARANREAGVRIGLAILAGHRLVDRGAPIRAGGGGGAGADRVAVHHVSVQ